MSNTVQALKGKVLVDKIESGERRTRNGIIILDDNGKPHGIRERWAQIYAVGPDVDDVEPGQWILIKHGRWSRGIEVDEEGNKITIRLIDNNCVMLWDKEQPDTTVFGFIDTVSKPSLSDFGKVL